MNFLKNHRVKKKSHMSRHCTLMAGWLDKHLSLVAFWWRVNFWERVNHHLLTTLLGIHFYRLHFVHPFLLLIWTKNHLFKAFLFLLKKEVNSCSLKIKANVVKSGLTDYTTNIEGIYKQIINSQCVFKIVFNVIVLFWWL